MSVGLREEALNKKLNEKLAEADLIKKQIETEKDRSKINSIKINIDTSDLDTLIAKLEHIKDLYNDVMLLQKNFYPAPTFTTNIVNKGASGGIIKASDVKASLDSLGKCIAKSSPSCLK